MNTTTQLTASRFIEEVRKIAQEEPDRTYNRNLNNHDGPSCSYQPNDKNPLGCIMGYALRRLGVELDPAWDKYNGSSIIHVFQALDHGTGIPLTPQQGNWLAAVQASQDSGMTWGQAIEDADERYL